MKPSLRRRTVLAAMWTTVASSLAGCAAPVADRSNGKNESNQEDGSNETDGTTFPEANEASSDETNAENETSDDEAGTDDESESDESEEDESQSEESEEDEREGDENEEDGNEPDENEEDGNEPDENEEDGNEADENEEDGSEADENEEDGSEADETETIDEATIRFVEDLADERFERAHERIAPSGRDEIAVGELEQIWMGYAAIGGDFREILETEAAVQDGHDAIDLTMAFERGNHELRVLVGEESNIWGLFFNGEYRRPEYVDPDAFTEETISVETGDCPLPGIVTRPTTEDTVPGVVLVHGSGPVDMDVTHTATKPFADLAEGLATRGTATLRYDKRTAACPGTVEPESHTLDTVTVDDALVAIDRLRSVDGVDEDRIVVAGSSMGGVAAPRIAARDGNLAGAVAMAAPARPFYEIALDQLEHQATVGSHEWEEKTTAYERWSTEIDRIRAGEYALDGEILGYPGALWNSLDEYDHLGTAAAVDLPLLFLQGERDYRVTVDDDLESWRSSLEGRADTEFESYGGLDHLFLPGEGPSVLFEYHARNNVDRRVVDDIAAWVDGS